MTLLAPVALVAAIALLALGGGFARLGAIGQVVSGPVLSEQSTLGSVGAATGARGGTASLGRALAAITSPAAAPAPAPAPASASGGRGTTLVGLGTGGAAGTGSGVGLAGGSATSGPAGGSAAATPGGGSSAPSGSGGGSGASGPSQVVQGVTTVASAVTSNMPGPLGPAATQAVQQTGSTVSGTAGSKPPALDAVTGLLPGR